MLPQLLRDLNSWHANVQYSAMRIARRLPPENLLKLVEMEAHHCRRRQRRGGLFALLVLSAALIIGYACLSQDPIAGMTALWGVGMTSLALAGGLSLYLPLRAHRNMATLLAQLEDPRFVGPALLMMANQQEDLNVVRSALLALQRLLPRVRADHADLFTAAHQKAMATLLGLSDPTLNLLVLQALEQVGDESTIPAVEKLTYRRHRQVQAAAQQCLLYLRTRADQRRQAQTLLRPSGFEAAPETLLRPVEAGGEAAYTHQLLRPQ